KRMDYLKYFDEYVDSDFIKVFTGIRRCGKTSILYSIIDELKNKGINEDNIIFISFEDPDYYLVENFKDLDKIVYEKVKDISGKIYLFFDEIQEVDKWEKSINGYRVKLDCDIYITGSNSKLLSNELSTLISGRYLEINVYPFSFKELLQYKKQIEKIDLSESDERKLFNNYYINYGGMPSILAFNTDEFRKSALRDIFNTIILNDVVNRFNIKKIDLFNRFVRYMMNTVGQTFSSNSIKNYLKDKNIHTTQDTLLKYNEFLQQSFFLIKCRRQDLIGKKLLKIQEKYYAMDHGFHHAIVESNQKRIPRVLENIVFVELLRRGYEVNVGIINKKEVDFVCQKVDKRIYIQVSYLMEREDTINREFGPLLSIPDKYDAYVLSMDDEDMSRDGIKHMNIIDFLKGNEI
ncbi:ATP-binding protein, partial [Methanobrevibacter sp.]|uniref:ATP-binding protein n=1 Tax=Methanobrevibacter sp. TaxID=66852 RepID=UPI0038904562